MVHSTGPTIPATVKASMLDGNWECCLKSWVTPIVNKKSQTWRSCSHPLYQFVHDDEHLRLTLEYLSACGADGA